MAALLLEPHRVADDQGRQCFLAEALLALVVLRTGERAEDSQHNADGESHVPVTKTRRSGSFFRSTGADHARRNGSLRSRLPVAANTALATAGLISAVPGSPMPPGFSVLATMCMSIFGDSGMRTTG